MYTLTLKNDYRFEVIFNYEKDHKPVSTLLYPHQENTYHNLSSTFLQVPGLVINFIYLGTEKLKNYPMIEGEFGVLIRTQATEVYYRYDGTGELILTLDKFGTYVLEVINGSAHKIQLEEITIKS